MPYQPRILAFLCNWCSYSAADQAGAAKLRYPAAVRPLRVMCSGRVDPTLVCRAFAHGADGVLICGCHLGDCHYVTGNRLAMGRIVLLRKVLASFGIEPGRIRLEWISAQESERFAAVVRVMTAELSALGPLDWPRVLAAAKAEIPASDVAERTSR